MKVQNIKIECFTDKWICKNCGKEIFQKPLKNAVCECKGRYIHFSKCKKCGKWFENPKNNKCFCSVECRGYELSNRKGKVELICSQCGKSFTRYNGNIDKNSKNNFCSLGCKNKFYNGEKTTKNCKKCGKEFTIYKSTLKTNASGKYCSQKCYWEDMQVPKKNYNGFAISKKLYFNKTQFCAVCGTTKKIQIHHIIPNRITQDQSKENLIPLCVKHHRQIEQITRELLEDCQDIKQLKFFLNNILRTRQLATYTLLKEM